MLLNRFVAIRLYWKEIQGLREILRFKILASREKIMLLDQEISYLAGSAARSTKTGLSLKIKK